MIGYYVHHHGAGHRHRAAAVARHLDDVTLLGSLGPSPGLGTPYVELPRDDRPAPAADADETAGGALHWAPLRHRGQQARSATVARFLVESEAALLVSDVSVEMVLLARLLSVPAVTVALRGDRLDRAHATGYDAACRIVAPWTRASQHEWPQRWLAKTTWTGMISRFDGRQRRPHACPLAGTCVVLLLGRGGHGMGGADLAEAAAVPGAHWHVLGDAGVAAPGGSVVMEGRVDDPWPALCSTDVVVAAAGDAAVADVAAAGAPLVAVPQERPFREQVEHVRLLADRGLCVAAEPWPDRRTWPGLLDAARTLGGHRWPEVADGHGAARAAGVLAEVAAVPRSSSHVA